MDAAALSFEDEVRQGPVRPGQLSVDFFEADDDVGFVDRRRGRLSTALFLIVWLTGWSFGCALLIHQVITKRELGMLLFGIPFWAAWLFVAGFILYLLLGRTYFALTSQGAFHILRVLAPISQRYVPLDEVKGFGPCSRLTGDKRPQTEYGIEMHTVGKPVKLLMGISQAERDWLCFRLNQQLALLDPERPAFRLPDDSRVATATRAVKSSKDKEVLQLGAVPLDPPSDNTWELYEGMALEFTQRGRFQPTALGAILFACLFWNVIVSVFLYALFVEGGPPGVMWWGVLLFLMPFIAIGLVLIGAVLAVLIEPFRRSVWQVADREICFWLQYGLFRRVWRYSVPTLSRIELRTAEKAKPARNQASATPQLDVEERSYYLSLVSRADETEVVKIEGLTEGEARWMADLILRQRTGWFR